MLICPCAGTEPKPQAELLLFKYRLSSKLSRNYRSSYSLIYSSIILLSSTEQVRKIRSSFSVLLFVHGYKPQVAAGYICQHANMISAAVHHGNVACLQLCVSQLPLNIQHHKDVGGNTEDLTAAIMSFASKETTGCGFSFGGAGEGAAEEISGATLCASCPDHKQSKHVFFTGPPACYSLHSCRAQRSESTDSNHCLTSRRTYHC